MTKSKVSTLCQYISSGGIQFTWPTGGPEGTKRSILFGDVRQSEADSFGFGLGGNFVHCESKSRGSSCTSKDQMASLGVSGNISQGESDVNYDLMDINGDGLPDRVSKSGGIKVAFNLGYGFAGYEPWSGGEINHSENEGKTLGGSIGFNDENYGFGGGLNLSKNDSESQRLLFDVNGDGLLDRINSGSGSLVVGLNTGSGFRDDIAYPKSIGKGLSVNTSTTLGGGVYFTIGIPVIVPPGIPRAGRSRQ